MATATLNVEPKNRPGARRVAVEESSPLGRTVRVPIGAVVPYPDNETREGWLAFDENSTQLGGIFSCDSLAIRALEDRHTGKQQEAQKSAARRKAKAIRRALASVESVAIETGDGESEAVKRASEIAVDAYGAEPADVNRAIDKGLATFAMFNDKPEPDDPATLAEPCEACGEVPTPADNRIDLALEACPDCGAAVCPDCLTDDGEGCGVCAPDTKRIADLEQALRLVLALDDGPESNQTEEITLAPKTRAQILAALEGGR